MKVITEKTLRNIIKRSLTEAMKYDKERRAYFPDYTGNTHSDAGKYKGKNGDGEDYSRNYYKWSDPEKEMRFKVSQFKNDLDPNPFNEMPDEDKENKAIDYLKNRDADNLVKNAIKEAMPNVISIIEEISKKYPVLKDYIYMSHFVSMLGKKLESYYDDNY